MKTLNNHRMVLSIIILLLVVGASVEYADGTVLAYAPPSPGGTGNQTASKGSGDASLIQPALINKVYLPVIVKACLSPLFVDDFSNPDSGWPVGVDGPISWSYMGGEYLMQITQTDWWAGAYRVPPVAVADFRAAVSVRNATGDYDTYYGLIFGLNPDWSQFYVFEISPDGYYFIFRYENDNWNILDMDYSPNIFLGILTNRLVVERNGSMIKAYANGQLLTTVVDSSFTGARYIGLIVENYSSFTLSGYFDNFGIYPITCDLSQIGSTSVLPASGEQFLSHPQLPRISGRLDPAERFGR